MLAGPGWFADAAGPVLREFVCFGLLLGKAFAVSWRLWILCPRRAYLAHRADFTQLVRRRKSRC